MECHQAFILIATHLCIVSTEILYVVPDNSTDAVSCPSKPCATLSQYLLDNGTLPVVSNVEYHFLPGEHHVPTNMTIQNLQNFSIIGTVSKPSPLAVLVLVDCPQSYSSTTQIHHSQGYRWPGLLLQEVFCQPCKTTMVHYRIYGATEGH